MTTTKTTTAEIARGVWASINVEQHPDRYTVLCGSATPTTTLPAAGNGLVSEEAYIDREIIAVRLPEGWSAGETAYGESGLWDASGAMRRIVGERRGTLTTVPADGDAGYYVALKIVDRRPA